MKSKKVKGASKKELGYPKLMQGKQSGVIVFFSDSEKGQVVNGFSGGFQLGDYDNGWNMDSFKDFNGTIELSNE